MAAALAGEAGKRNRIAKFAEFHYFAPMKTTTVTATEANRSFSRLLREVERGGRIEITSHGRKVAVLQAADAEDATAARLRQAGVIEKLRKRWAEQEFVVVDPWTRDELYERD